MGFPWPIYILPTVCITCLSRIFWFDWFYCIFVRATHNTQLAFGSGINEVSILWAVYSRIRGFDWILSLSHLSAENTTKYQIAVKDDITKYWGPLKIKALLENNLQFWGLKIFRMSWGYFQIFAVVSSYPHVQLIYNIKAKPHRASYLTRYLAALIISAQPF